MAVVAAILSIYSYPALRTAFTTKSTRLPAVSAADLGLYLSLSRLEETQSGMVENPYYHISVPASGVSYLRFRSGPMLFGAVNKMLAGHLWSALFFWNLVWWLLLCLSAIWLFENFLPQPSLELVLAGVSLLMLFSVEGFGRTIAGWTHLPQPGLGGGLLYLRPFTPQVMMPLFVCYVGLQMRALRDKSIVAWGLMALLQFLAFTTFPFATLMMAGITAVVGVWYIVARPQDSPWRVLLGFMLVCAIADIAFARHDSGGVGLGFPGQSLIKFQPALALRAIRKMWILTAILVAATALTRRLRPEVKWTLLGLGLSNLLFVMGDAVASEPVFFLGDHIGYFYQPTIIILFMFLVSAHILDGVQSHRLTRALSLWTVGLCFVYGLLMAEDNYKGNLTHNIVQADLADWFAQRKVSGSDLVFTQFADSSYDACEWIPLLSQGEVLFCRNAQLALTGEQNLQVQRLREVLYLYFNGKDRHWFETTTMEFDRYGLYGDLKTFRKPNEYAERLVTLRNEMIPLYYRIERGDPDMHDFFRGFRRVWIIQERQDPAFVDGRLGSYLQLQEKENFGSLVITPATPF